MKKLLVLLAALSLALGACEAKKADEAKPEGEAKEGEAKEGEAKEGEAKEGEAKEGEAKEGEAAEGEGEADGVPGEDTAAVSPMAGEGEATDNPHIATILKLYEVSNTRTFPADVFAENLEAEMVYSVMMPGTVGLAEIKMSMEQTWAMSSDMKTVPMRIIDVGNNTYVSQVYSYGTFDGAMPGMQPTNEKLGIGALVTHTFDDAGKIAKMTLRRNEMEMLTQIGVMPPMGEAPPVRPLPTAEVEILKADETVNTSLVEVVKAVDALEAARPFDPKAYVAMIADDVVMGMPPREGVEKEQMGARQAMFAEGLSEVSAEYLQVWTAGDMVITDVMGRAKHTGKIGPFEPTNKEFTNPYLNIVRIRDGKIAAVSGYGNPLFALAQLGLLPPEMMRGAEAKAAPADVAPVEEPKAE